jgi:hypothetical protein
MESQNFAPQRHQITANSPIQSALEAVLERKTGDFRKIYHAIGQLITTGEIVEVWKPGQRGKPTKRWQWQG